MNVFILRNFHLWAVWHIPALQSFVSNDFLILLTNIYYDANCIALFIKRNDCHYLCKILIVPWRAHSCTAANCFQWFLVSTYPYLLLCELHKFVFWVVMVVFIHLCENKLCPVWHDPALQPFNFTNVWNLLTHIYHCDNHIVSFLKMNDSFGLFIWNFTCVPCGTFLHSSHSFPMVFRIYLPISTTMPICKKLVKNAQLLWFHSNSSLAIIQSDLLNW